MANTKLSIVFTPEDMKVLNKLQKSMASTLGRVTVISVLRSAIRTAATVEANRASVR